MHNSGEGARYTLGRTPVAYARIEPCADRAHAQRLEAAFKKLDRSEKLTRLASPPEGVFLVPYREGSVLESTWDDPRRPAEAAEIGEWRPESGAFRPRTSLKLCWNQKGLSGMFRVEDRNVLCARVLRNSDVYRDSCVEIFLKTKPEGYFNFEWSACATQLAGFVTDPTRNPDGSLRGFAFLDDSEAECVRALGSLGPPPLALDGPRMWTLAFEIPFSLLGLKGREGEGFSGNFQKCADAAADPHWGSWRPLSAKNFHQPENFGRFFLVG